MSSSDLVESSTTLPIFLAKSGSPAFFASTTTGFLPLRKATYCFAFTETSWPFSSITISPVFNAPKDCPPSVMPTVPSVPRIDAVMVPVLNLNWLFLPVCF